MVCVPASKLLNGFMDSSGPSKVDWAVAMEAVGSNEKLLVDLIGIFFDEYPKLIEAVRTAIEAREPVDLQRSAHTLKGSLRYFGDTEAARLAFELENMGRDKDFSAAMRVFERLEPATAKLIPQLQSYLDKHACEGAD